MTYISPVDIDNAGDAQSTLDSVKQKLGVVPNIFATMAQSPVTLDGFLAFSGALGNGQLSASLREQIALVVAGTNACDYCASAHTFLAKASGVNTDETSLNLQGKSSDNKTQAVLEFAQAVVENKGRLGENALENIRRAGLSESEIVEVIAHVGINIFTNYFNHVAQTEIDFPLVTVAANRKAA